MNQWKRVVVVFWMSSETRKNNPGILYRLPVTRSATGVSEVEFV